MRLTRRKWLALAALGACERRRAVGYPGYALIATSGENSVAAVDLTSFRLVNQIEVGAAPTAIVPFRNRSCVLTPATGSVHVIDAELHRVFSQRLAGQLTAIRLTPGEDRLVAVAGQDRELIVADPVSLRPVRRQKLEAEPVALDLVSTPYAAVSEKHGVVELFHLASGQSWRAQLPGEIGAVRFRADGQLLLVSGLSSRSLVALEVPSLRPLAELPLAMAPEELCFNADAGQLFVSGDGMDAVAIVFPYNVLEVEQTVLAGRDPGVMACSSSPAYLFVASHSGSDVCILDVDSRKVIGFVEVGQNPVYIAITPDSQYALVLDQFSGDMAVIHVTAIRANRTKSGASLFTLVQVGAKPVHAAIVPKQPG
jgi:YVTN family beta-propeller protein